MKGIKVCHDCYDISSLKQGDTINSKKNHINIFAVIVLIIGILFIATFIKKPTTFSQEEQIAPHYVEYSDTTLDKAKQNGNAVLFFAATTWCTTCSALDKELKDRSTSLPVGVTVLKIDYDNDREMKTKYSVTTQHTMIQLDRGGQEVKRWIGGNFDTLVQNIK